MWAVHVVWSCFEFFFFFPFLLTLNNLFYYFLLYVLIFKYDYFYNINYIFFYLLNLIYVVKTHIKNILKCQYFLLYVILLYIHLFCFIIIN
jgi:hypothetical protein